MRRGRELWFPVILLAVLASGCEINTGPAEAEADADADGSGTTGGGTVVITGVSGSVSTTVLCVGTGDGTRSVQITSIVVSPANASQEVTFASLTPAVLSVSSTGLVTAVATGQGKVRITSKANTEVVHEITFNVVACQAPAAQAPVLTFTASPLSIMAGQFSNLSWSCSNGTSLVASGAWSGSKSLTGSESVSPGQTATFGLVCSGPGGTDSKSVTITVTSLSPFNFPQSSLALWMPGCPASGQSSMTLTMNGTPTSVTSSNPSQVQVSFSGNVVTFTAVGVTTQPVTITATNAQGQTATITVTVQACPTQAPTLTLTAIPPQVQQGQSSSLEWVSQFTTSCTASNGWSGTKPISGQQTVTPNQTTTYHLVCVGPGGSVERSVTVGVTIPSPFNFPQTSLALWMSGCPASGPSTRTLQLSGNAVSVTSSNPGQVQVSFSGSSVTFTSVGVTTTPVTVTATNAQGQTATIAVTVQACPPPPPAPTCPAPVDYSPKGGTVGVNQNRGVSLDPTPNWPTNCDVIWYTGSPSRLHVNGGDNVRQVENQWFYSGRNALIRGIAAGTATVCAHVISIGSDGVWRRVANGERCYTWTITP